MVGSVSMLLIQIDSSVYERQAVDNKKVHNFSITLPKIQSDLARDILKSEYNFEFLDMKAKRNEKNFEQGLIDKIVQFILELGRGFAFVGRQYHLKVGKRDFYIDLLFYNICLKSYVVFELKVKSFEPEFVGKLEFYVAAIDDILKGKNDNATIGILLCSDSDKEVQDKSIQCITKPIGVSTYKISKELPEELRGIEGVKKLLEST